MSPDAGTGCKPKFKDAEDADHRCTAAAALKYAWITDPATDAERVYRGEHVPFDNKPLHSKNCLHAKDIVQKLSKFHQHSELEKKALEVIAHRLEDDEIRELGKTFLALDANHDGVVTVKELRNGIQKMEKMNSVPGMEELLEFLNHHHLKFIEYTEFLAAVMDEKYYQKENLCWVAFRYFDKNGDKKITRNELLDALKREELKEDLEDPAFISLRQSVMDSIAEFDGDGDSCIDFSEFSMMMRQGRLTEQGRRLSMSQAACPSAKFREKAPCDKCHNIRFLRLVPRTNKALCTACALEHM